MTSLKNMMKNDQGLIDLKSTIISCIIILTVIGVSTLASTRIIPQYQLANLKERMLAVSTEQSSNYSTHSKYSPEEQLTADLAGTRTLTSNEGGCFTTIGASHGKGYILESGQEDPQEIMPNTTAHCIGESSLRESMSFLELPVTGRTGKEVLAAPQGMKTNGTELSWNPVAGAERYTVTINQNGADKPPVTTATTKIPYTALPGDTLNFSVQPIAVNAESFTGKYTERLEPANIVPNPGFDSASSWSQGPGNTGKFQIVKGNGQCPGIPLNENVMAIAPGAVIRSGYIYSSTFGHEYLDTEILIDSCGADLPIIGLANSASHYLSKFKVKGDPRQWKKRSPDLQENPDNSRFSYVYIYNPSTETMYVDNIDIKLIR